ncbi:hypothetical protein LF599_17670 [Pseudodesulfovibrio thermohalotolerans]|uniref:hypothetical protein n=1 Tax=Pseudodesulfovibrio thermohalotolerans TaxID=2880651 RepID=UPI0022B9E043|nr:hypothetical protein [Pseudodesulfovibrio thermohalotolerans]WFS62464.1 hypothetical protein LF599_17670 [Pseudodesulfovibrio thermohalotolerans]
MNMRTKSALVVTVGLLLLFAVMFTMDYTGRYVSDRFFAAVEAAPAGSDRTYSLDAFMEYYDWDSVCVVLPGAEHAFSTILGRTYVPKGAKDGAWSLVFIKAGAVNAEITVDPDVLGPPNPQDDPCFDRWGAVFTLARDERDRPKMIFVGH